MMSQGQPFRIPPVQPSGNEYILRQKKETCNSEVSPLQKADSDQSDSRQEKRGEKIRRLSLLPSIFYIISNWEAENYRR